MDTITLLIINLSVGAVVGIGSAIKDYRQKRKEKKMKKRVERLEKLEKEKEEQQQAHEPIETPSEAGYYKPENPTALYAE